MRTASLAAAALLIAAAPAAAQVSSGDRTAPAPEDAEPTTLAAATHERYGAYLVDGRGRALYLLEADTRGADGRDAESACTGRCANVWPPVLASADDPQVGPRLRPDLLGTVRRPDGRTQATYGGWPLYRYAEDRGAGTAAGQDVRDEWGEWYLVSPEGEPVEEGEG